MQLLDGDVKKEDLLLEVEDVLRGAPQNEEFGTGKEATLVWIGRAAAALERWDFTKGATISIAADNAQSLYMAQNATGFMKLKTLLWQARADLRMQVGQLSRVVAQGQVFEYFDELRKFIEPARSEVFFVDPYLDADFVSQYLPHVAAGVAIRLLGHKRMATLLPAVEMFVRQAGKAVGVRSSSALHDRFLFVDRKACYLSGASFKDGAKNAPTTLAQIVDAVEPMLDTYDRLWHSGNVERP